MSRGKSETKQAAPGDFRVRTHPILPIVRRPEISFTFNGNPMKAYEGEVITTALFAGGVQVFGHHPRDGSPQGIFCANGQCSQCTVLVGGLPVKGCMTPVRAGMKVRSCEGSPALPADDALPKFREIPTIETDVLVIGGGPAGINAAIELGLLGAKTLVVDDKNEFGGKLTLQTHTFFGSRDDCYAGTRGIEIARILTHQLERFPSVSVMLGTTAVGAFHDKQVGLEQGGAYLQVKPRAVLVACGAREKNLAFPGCDLPGVYGAGAFQTLLNRDLVRPTERLFIVGGGNVGLITAYHAIQAGIKVVGLVEALPQCGGYKVHLDKLRRLGVPILTSHTVLKAEGREMLEKITIAAVDRNFKPVPGSEKSYRVDTLLDRRRARARERALREAGGIRNRMLEGGGCRGDRRSLRRDIQREDHGAEDRPVSRLRGRYSRRMDLDGGDPAKQARADDAAGPSEAREEGVSADSLRAGDSLQSVRGFLPEEQHRAQGRFDHEQSRFRRRLHRLRELRRGLPGPRDRFDHARVRRGCENLASRASLRARDEGSCRGEAGRDGGHGRERHRPRHGRRVPHVEYRREEENCIHRGPRG